MSAAAWSLSLFADDGRWVYDGRGRPYSPVRTPAVSAASQVCDDVVVRINCWHEVGRKNAGKDVIRLRRVSAAEQKELRAAIRAARAGDGDGVLFRLERGYSGRGRASARLAVGIGVVVLVLAAVVAFVVPDSAAAIIGFGVVPAAMVAGFTALFSMTYDTGVCVRADGVLRVEGWGGIRELDLRGYSRVTVADDPPNDIGWIEG